MKKRDTGGIEDVIQETKVSKKIKELFQELVNEPEMKRYMHNLENFLPEVYGHSFRVALVAMSLAYENKLPDKDIKDIGYASILHDLGKLEIPESILNKSSKLNKKEQKIMREHVRRGFLKVIDSKYQRPKTIAITHHESRMVEPYPRTGADRRKGSRDSTERRNNYSRDEPLYQILAVADAYDALASKRAYKEPMTDGQIEEILRTELRVNPKYIDQVMEIQRKGENGGLARKLAAFFFILMGGYGLLRISFSITGNVISNSNKFYDSLGIISLVMGIVGAFFFLKKS